MWKTKTMPDDTKIDVVYTWVKDTPEFIAQKNSYLDNPEVEANNSARFRDHDELKYSIRSVLKFIPWVNHIYIVTDNQIPDYINFNHPKVTLVSHQEIFKDTVYPNYNSNAIEWNLINIPNLNEHFIYFNDDVFVGKPLKPNYFYNKTGIPIWALMKSSGKGNFHPSESATIEGHRFTYRTIAENTGIKSKWKVDHAPMPLTKSMLEELVHTFSKEVESTKQNRFRQPTDFGPSRALPFYFLAIKKLKTHSVSRFFRINRHCIKIAVLSNAVKTRNLTQKAFKAIENKVTATFAINDSEDTTETMKQQWINRLKLIYSNKSEIEQ